MKDVNGKEILVGDTVVVAQRRGNHCWLSSYPVIEAYPGLAPKIQLTDKNGHKRNLLYVRGEDTIAVVGR